MVLVSVIIPSYNRANLITATLDSVLAQTYKDWECIVIDDGSKDYILELLEEFSKKDCRMRYYSRPSELIHGANSCRNHGFEKSSGDFIIWFDSDDLMTPDHIESKLKEIQEKKLDFVVAKTQNFKESKLLEPYQYDKKEYGIKASDFILMKIHWYTYDVILKREVAAKISWNDKMKSWQDYNYFCKMLLVTEKGTYLDKILTYRRIHSRSIQKSLTKDSKTFNAQMLENRVLTFKDISEHIDASTRKELVFGMMNICFELAKMRKGSKFIKQVRNIVEIHLGKKSKLYFNIALVSGVISTRGYFLLSKAKNR